MAASTDDLYRVFARYPLGAADGCPHCVNAEDHACIRSAPMRRLSAKHLGRYAFKAMTTWGTETDYKHFVPRILELAAFDGEARGYPGLEPDFVARKILSAGWATWPDEERVVVSRFVHAVWIACLSRGAVDGLASWMETLATLGDDLERCIDAWTRDGSRAATNMLAEFVLAFGDEILGGRGTGLLSDHPAQRARVARWLLSAGTRERLERVFFDAPESPDARRCAEAADLIGSHSR